MKNERIKALFEAIYGQVVKASSDEDTHVNNYLLALGIIFEIYKSVSFDDPLTESDLLNLLYIFMREQSRSFEN